MESTRTRMAEIEIRGHMYSLDKVPDEDSAIVKEEEEKMLGAIDLETLANDLNQVGSFIRIAYNGVGAAGPKFTEMQIEIQRLGFSATKICNKSIDTTQSFKTASSRITTNLLSTYKYLLDNLELMALETLSGVSEVAGNMEKAANELHDEFEKLEKEVMAALERMQKAKGDESQLINDMVKRLQKLQLEKEQLQILIEEQRKGTQEAIVRCCKRDEIEDDVIEQAHSTDFKNVFKRLCYALTSRYIGVDVNASDVQLKVLSDAIKRAHELEKEVRKERRENTAKMTEFLCKMLDCKTEEKMAEVAEGALHHAIGALKELSLVAMQEATFWRQMREHCKSLASSTMQKQVQTALKLPEEDRMKVWTSSGFKTKAIEFYAGWVALHSICGKYVVYIKKTQQNLLKYMKENPTFEESHKNVKMFIQEFLEHLRHQSS